MSTLGIMKERIASELRRDDLSSATEFRVLSSVSDIHDAIHTAITQYQDEPFYFNQDRASVVFNTVASQDRYTSSDDADIARIIKIHYAYINIGGFGYKLFVRRADLMEGSNMGSNALVSQPAFYSWFAESIVLEPIPDQVYQLRFGCTLKTAAPTMDNEANNRWMTDAELLIRCRAKAELYAHVIKEPDKASLQMQMAQMAYERLHQKTADMTSPEVAMVEIWDPYS